MKTKNPYDNTRRRLRAEETRQSIISALGSLWKQYAISDITLDMIADEAGITKRTILRKFGSKENLMVESLSYDPAEISKQRDLAVPGDLDNILRTLLTNYENIGDAAIRTIQLEPKIEIAQKIGEKGRVIHREWCKRVFAPFLPELNSKDYPVQLNSFIAATEIFLWKLFRRDLKFSQEKTFSIFKNMLEGVIHQSKQTQ